MIKIFYVQGQYAPCFVCDVCSKRIDRAGEGIALSGITSTDAGVLTIAELAALSEIGEPEEYQVLHVHKGKCMAILEQRFQRERTSTGGDGLDEHVYYLTRNLGLTLDDLKRIEDEA